MATTLTEVGLSINKGKIKILEVSTTTADPIKLESEALEEVEAFIHLGSAGNKTDVKSQIGKTRAAFFHLKNIWNFKELTLQTKIRLFNSNSKSVLLYGAETWRPGNNEESANLC